MATTPPPPRRSLNIYPFLTGLYAGFVLGIIFSYLVERHRSPPPLATPVSFIITPLPDKAGYGLLDRIRDTIPKESTHVLSPLPRTPDVADLLDR